MIRFPTTNVKGGHNGVLLFINIIRNSSRGNAIASSLQARRDRLQGDANCHCGHASFRHIYCGLLRTHDTELLTSALERIKLV